MTRTPARLVAWAAGAIALAAYAATASRTITWWDGSHYPLLASTLSISNPPGSLLLTLIGWVATRIPIVFPVAFRLSLVGALLGATTVAIATHAAIRVATPAGRSSGAAELAGGLVAGLVLAFAFHFWTYSTQFTPYVLSALFTALILVAFLGWWERAESDDAIGRLALLFLLFGLDVSVHRTNVLLLPGVLLGVALRRPGALFRPRVALTIAGAFALGLAFQLAYIPLSRREPFLNVSEPNTVGRVWSYVRLEATGGNFLVNLWPRRADWLRVQLFDWIAFLARNLGSGPWLWRALVPALGLAGAAALVRRAPRLGWALIALFLCAGLGAVAYFNRPAYYFRPLDRHYLPSLVALVPLIAAGAAAALRLAATRGAAPAWALAAGLLAAPVTMAVANRAACDRSHTRYAETYARAVFASLEPGAILFTNGDNDTFPLWYLQHVERVRTDVLVVNLPLSNTPECIRALRRAAPEFATLLADERLDGVLAPTPVKDSLVVLHAAPRAAGARLVGDAYGDSVVVKPTGDLLGHDRVVLEMLERNAWRRPVYCAVTVDRSILTWIWPLTRVEGMAQRVVPSTDASVWDVALLRRRVHELLPRSGAADSSQVIEPEMKAMLSGYASMAFQLIGAQLSRGDGAGALETLALIERHFPIDRVSPDPRAMRGYVENARKAAEAQVAAGRP